MLTNLGKAWLLEIVSQWTSMEDIEIGLYTNTVTWGPSTVMGDITECAHSGYVRNDFVAAGSATVTGGVGKIAGVSVGFLNTSGAGVVVRGFFYISKDTDVLIGGDAFADPLTIPATIGSLSINPEMKDDNLP